MRRAVKAIASGLPPMIALGWCLGEPVVLSITLEATSGLLATCTGEIYAPIACDYGQECS
jgi:hypothetical protein